MLDDEQRSIALKFGLNPDNETLPPISSPLLAPSPVAGEAGEPEVVTLRRHASAIFTAGQRLEFASEQLSRLASSASAELSPGVRTLLLSRRDALRREREFFSRRLSLLGERMEVSFNSHTRHTQLEWLRQHELEAEADLSRSNSPLSSPLKAPPSPRLRWSERGGASSVAHALAPALLAVAAPVPDADQHESVDISSHHDSSGADDEELGT